MKTYFVLLSVLLILSLLQAVFLPLNLVLLAVVIWAALREPREVYAGAFLGGLILDLAVGQTLGFSSLFFLFFSFLIQLYSRRFDFIHPVVMAVFVALASLVYKAAAGHISLASSFGLGALALLVGLWLYRNKDKGGGLKLGVPL